MSRILLASLTLLLASLAPANVAATGSSQALATPIGEGTHGGWAENDHWYRVSVPAGKVAHVAFTIVSGDAWNDLSFVDASGDPLVWVSSGGTGAYDPDEADAWLVVDTFWGPSEYSFTLSFLNAPAQNDAGSGQDAGQQQATALAIQPGRIQGRVMASAGDVGDWYSLAAPAGTIVDVHSAQGAFVDVYDADGRHLESIAYYDSAYSPRAYGVVAGDAPLFLHVDWAESYSFVVEVSQPADLVVEGLEVRDVELGTDAGPAGVSYAREVLVTLSNAGDGPSRKASLVVRSTHEGAATTDRVLGERAIDLAPGEQVVVAIRWDSTGQAGDVTLVARVANEFDAVLDNNAAEARAFVLATGLPTSLDLLNHEARAAGSTLRVEYGGDRIGVATPVGFLGFDRGVLTLP